MDQLADYHYELPEELIAKEPLAQRSASRMLQLLATATQPQHGQFTDLLTLLNPGDCLVFNNTKVIPARLYGQKSTGGQLEILVERILSAQCLLVHLKASKAPKVGSLLLIADTHWLVIERRQGLFVIELQGSSSVTELLERAGEMPLPPYIKRQVTAADTQRYQTVYAKHLGAVAAPTAGLHFDENILQQLHSKGVNFAYVTLHVGAGTFQPVRVKAIKEHKMHTEWYEVPQQTCNSIKKAQENGKRVIAVGTTSLRSLESAALQGELQATAAESDLFIYPGFSFKVVEGLITNFHLPQSTLLMLVSALGGYQRIKQAYAEAVQQRYRFFSYGDAMFIEREKCGSNY